MIQETIIYYLLVLFEDIHNEINKYYNDKLIANHCKLYQTEIFKFMSIPEIKITNDKNSISPFIEISEKLIDKINMTKEGKENDLNKLNNELKISFEQINKDNNQEKLGFVKIYEEKIKNVNIIASNEKKKKYLINENINEK